jgi:hypothetical protein
VPLGRAIAVGAAMVATVAVVLIVAVLAGQRDRARPASPARPRDRRQGADLLRDQLDVAKEARKPAVVRAAALRRASAAPTAAAGDAASMSAFTDTGMASWNAPIVSRQRADRAPPPRPAQGRDARRGRHGRPRRRAR